MSNKKMIINAMNVHSGGGLTILKTLLDQTQSIDRIVFIDKRANTDFSNLPNVHFVSPTIFGRLFAEYKIFRLSRNTDFLFSVGNLPPLFRCKCMVYVYIHNIFLFDKTYLNTLNLNIKLRIWIETLWINYFFKTEYNAIVQTPSMKRLFEQKFDNKATVIPLSPSVAKIQSYRGKMKFDFIYISNNLAYKNHKNLLKGWMELAESGIFPSLALTISEDELRDFSKELLLDLGTLNIFCLGHLSHQATMNALKKSKCLIFPSLVESFGLPLIEAKKLNIPIIASEKDFVRDTVVPKETFDPLSSLSIKRAVTRFLKVNMSSYEEKNISTLFF